MSDSYQAVYDAVSRKFGNPDVAQAIRDACHLDASYAIDAIKQEFCAAAMSMQEPSAIYKPVLSIDGNQWCALYGEDLVRGVAGFGESPAKAMADFNINWYKKLPSETASPGA